MPSNGSVARGAPPPAFRNNWTVRAAATNPSLRSPAVIENMVTGCLMGMVRFVHATQCPFRFARPVGVEDVLDSCLHHVLPFILAAVDDSFTSHGQIFRNHQRPAARGRPTLGLPWDIPRLIHELRRLVRRARGRSSNTCSPAPSGTSSASSTRLRRRIRIVGPVAIKDRLPSASGVSPRPSARLRRFIHLPYPLPTGIAHRAPPGHPPDHPRGCHDPFTWRGRCR